MIMTTCGGQIDDVIGTQVRALDRFTPLCLHARNIALEENQADGTVACTALVQDELHPIAFLVFANGPELLPEAVRPHHQPLSIPKIDGLPATRSAIPYRYGKRSFRQFSPQPSSSNFLWNRNTLHRNKRQGCRTCGGTLRTAKNQLQGSLVCSC